MPEEHEKDNLNTPSVSKYGPIFKYALLIGTTLIIIGLLSIGNNFGRWTINILITSVGLGIVLGSFGTDARIENKNNGFIIAGTGATALIIFFAIHFYINKSYTYIDVSHANKNQVVSEITLSGKENYLGKHNPENKGYEFVIFEGELDHDITIEIVKIINGEEKEFQGCVNKEHIEPHLSSGKTIVWIMNDKSEVFDVSNGRKKIADTTSCSYFEETTLAFNLIPQANAEELKSETKNPASVDKVLNALNSDIKYERRFARTQLAQFGLNAIPQATELATSENATYREKLGSYAALAEIVKNEEKNKEEISSIIDKEKLSEIYSDVRTQESSIKIYSTMFLFNLQDERLMEIAIEDLKKSGGNELSHEQQKILTGALKGANEKAVSEFMNSFKEINRAQAEELSKTIER